MVSQKDVSSRAMIAIAACFALCFTAITWGVLDSIQLRRDVKYYKELATETQGAEWEALRALAACREEPPPVSVYPVKFEFIAKCDGGFARFVSADPHYSPEEETNVQ